MTKIIEKNFSTYILQISVKFANDVFFVPILTTCGGFMTNFFFSPVTISGFLARIMSNTLVNNCGHKKKLRLTNLFLCYKCLDDNLP